MNAWRDELREQSDLELIALEWAAGLLPPERLPQIAVDLLGAGFDSPTLRIIAGLLPAETSDAHDQFERALRELGHAHTRPEGRRGLLLVREFAARMVDGRIPPYHGARAIWQLWLDYEDPDWPVVPRLDAFPIGYDEWEQLPDLRPKIEADLIEEARRLRDLLDGVLAKRDEGT